MPLVKINVEIGLGNIKKKGILQIKVGMIKGLLVNNEVINGPIFQYQASLFTIAGKTQDVKIESLLTPGEFYELCLDFCEKSNIEIWEKV